MNFIGAWDGTAWRPIGGGLGGGTYALCLYDPDGSGPAPAQLTAGGVFPLSGDNHTVLNGVARLDGAAWQPFGTGVGPPEQLPTVYCMTPWNGSLVIGGLFLSAGGIPVGDIARWDSSGWHALPAGAGDPDTLTVIDGSLYAGGYWRIPGQPPTEHTGIFRFDDPNWVTVGQNFPDDDVRAFAVFQGQMYAGGDFVNGGNSYIARFDGTNWVPVGGGMNGRVYAMCLFDPDGPGPMPEQLIVGGGFTMAGGQAANRIAAWDGAAWHALGMGTTGSVRALTVWNNQLVAAGEFYAAGGLISPGMAFWGCPQAAPCYANCDQSTVAPILNVNDFACFLSAFASGSPYANCDASTTVPALNVNDFVCFLTAFARGCQ